MVVRYQTRLVRIKPGAYLLVYRQSQEDWYQADSGKCAVQCNLTSSAIAHAVADDQFSTSSTPLSKCLSARRTPPMMGSHGTACKQGFGQSCDRGPIIC